MALFIALWDILTNFAAMEKYKIMLRKCPFTAQLYYRPANHYIYFFSSKGIYFPQCQTLQGTCLVRWLGERHRC